MHIRKPFQHRIDISKKVHHILAEIIQGGLVLETNVEEIDNSGAYENYPRPNLLLILYSTPIGQVTKGIICVCQPAVVGPRSRWCRVSRRKPKITVGVVNGEDNWRQSDVIWAQNIFYWIFHPLRSRRDEGSCEMHRLIDNLATGT